MSLRPTKALALALMLAGPQASAARSNDAIGVVRSALATSSGSLRGERSLSMAAQALATGLRDDLAVMAARQSVVAGEHRRLVEELAALRAKEQQLAETVTVQRRATASGMIDMLGRSRRAPTAPVVDQRANLVVAGTVEPWHASEQEQRQAKEAIARARALVGLRAVERQVIELSISSLGARNSVAREDALAAALVTTELVSRVTLMVSGLRRLEREQEALHVATAASLRPVEAPVTGLLARTEVSKPSLFHEAELLLASLGSPRLGGRVRVPVESADRQLVVPVDGAVAERFGQIRNGLRHRGLTLVTDHAQPVQAPRGGVIAFAGAFRSFGLVLIINHGHEYHSLVSGLTRLDVKRGDIVAKGQSIGWLDADAAGPGSIYLELRHGGEPIDPWPALAAHEDKVRG